MFRWLAEPTAIALPALPIGYFRKWVGGMAVAQIILVIVMIAVASIGESTTQKLTKRNREWWEKEKTGPPPHNGA